MVELGITPDRNSGVEARFENIIGHRMKDDAADGCCKVTTD